MTRKGPRLILQCLATLYLTATGYSAAIAAPGAERGDTVVTRERRDLEPLGIAQGSFRIYPEVGLSAAYNDNIFASDINTESDEILTVSPGVAVASGWRRHAVNLSASAALGRYRNFTSEDFDDWQVSGNTRLDMLGASRLFFAAGFAQLHEPRDSPNDAGGLEPTEFTSTTAYLDYRHSRGRFYVLPTADFNRLEYDDVPALFLGVPIVIDQGDRDRDELTFGVQAGFEQGPDSNRYIRLRSISRDYDELQKLTGLDRSSDGYEVGAGIEFDLGGVTRGELYLGYRDQDYKLPLPDISDPIFDISLIWAPSRMTNLELNIRRTFGETTALVYSGYVSTLSHLGFEYELRRNLLFHADLALVNDDYDGIGAARREDDTFVSGVGLSWLLNRHLIVTLRHDFTKRDTKDSTIPAGLFRDDFESHAASLRVDLRH